MRRTILIAFVVVISCVTTSKALEKKSAEVIHWWISGSEAAALNVLTESFEKKGYKWVDIPVKTSYDAKSAALTRIISGTPPAIMQWHAGVSLQTLWNEDILQNINDIAAEMEWQNLLPETLLDNISVDDNIVAIPLTIHGSNWLWSNATVLKKLNLVPPGSWRDFFSIAPLIKQQGYIPLAVGGQSWQVRALFLSLILDVGGPDFYKETIIQHKPAALQSSKMVKVFQLLSKIKEYTDVESPNRSWNDTTKLVIEGKATFQIMGDWAKGEFLQAGKKVKVDFDCSLAPGSNGTYLLVADVFATPKAQSQKENELQRILAQLAMSKEIQEKFSLIKGSIPPRLDIDPAKFDLCSQMAIKTVANPGSSLPGFNMANSGVVGSAIVNVVYEFWKQGGDPSVAAKNLRRAVTEAKM